MLFGYWDYNNSLTAKTFQQQDVFTSAKVNDNVFTDLRVIKMYPTDIVVLIDYHHFFDEESVKVLLYGKIVFIPNVDLGHFFSIVDPDE